LACWSHDTDEYPLIAPVVPRDTSPPVTVVSVNGLRGDFGWYVSVVNFTLQPFDNIAGVNSTYYRMDGGAWTEYTGRVFVTADGVHLLEYYSTDDSSNDENVHLLDIRIDSENPQPLQSMKLSYRLNNTGVITIPIEFGDNTSGIRDFAFGSPSSYYATVYYSKDTTYIQVAISNGSYTFATGVYDMAGNHCSVFIYINSSLMVNRNPLSPGGPYGYWFTIGVTADIVLVILFLWLTSVIIYGPSRPSPPGKQPGELDRGEVEDGYPKYMKRV
jgi:hypothetical protein